MHTDLTVEILHEYPAHTLAETIVSGVTPAEAMREIEQRIGIEYADYGAIRNLEAGKAYAIEDPRSECDTIVIRRADDRASGLFADDAQCSEIEQQPAGSNTLGIYMPRDRQGWVSTLTRHIDADDVLADSNYECVRDEMSAYDDDVDDDRVGTWTYSSIDILRVRIRDESGAYTDAFRWIITIMDQLADYPIWDEDDYSRRESEAFDAELRQEIGHCALQYDDDDDDVAEILKAVWEALDMGVTLPGHRYPITYDHFQSGSELTNYADLDALYQYGRDAVYTARAETYMRYPECGGQLTLGESA